MQVSHTDSDARLQAAHIEITALRAERTALQRACNEQAEVTVSESARADGLAAECLTLSQQLPESCRTSATGEATPASDPRAHATRWQLHRARSLAELHAEVVAKKGEIEQLQQELAKQASALAAATAAAQELRAQCCSSDEALGDLRQAHEQAVQECERLRAELAAALEESAHPHQCPPATSTAGDASTAGAAAALRLEDTEALSVRAERDTAQALVTVLRSKIAALAREHAERRRASSERSGCSGRGADAGDTDRPCPAWGALGHAQAAQFGERPQAAAQHSEAHAEGVQAERDAAVAEAAQAKASVQQAHARIDEQVDNVRALLATVERTEAAVAEAARKAQSLSAERDAAMAHCAQLRTALSERSRAGDAARAAMRQFAAAFEANLEEQSAAIRERLDGMQQRCAHLEAAFAQALGRGEQRRNLVESLEVAQCSVAGFKADLEQVHEQHSAAVARLQALGAEHARCKTEAAHTLHAHQTRIQDLEEQLADARHVRRATQERQSGHAAPLSEEQRSRAGADAATSGSEGGWRQRCEALAAQLEAEQAARGRADEASAAARKHAKRQAAAWRESLAGLREDQAQMIAQWTEASAAWDEERAALEAEAEGLAARLQAAEGKGACADPG